MSYKDQVQNEYFEWLYNYACAGRVNNQVSYRKLFLLLHSIEFDFYIREDVNRAVDGIDLRTRFATVKGDERIIDILDDACSILEMILALAIRCEETIMDNPQYGDRTRQWFWNMISNLGLHRFTDDNFNEKIILERVYNFMERRYEPNGRGGLFYIRNCEQDLRNIEIWSQLCLYLNNFD